MKQIAIFALGALFSVAVWAQGPGGDDRDAAGNFTEVNGLVTVTAGDQLVSAAVGNPVFDGNRIVTTTGSSMTVKLNNGCVIKLKSSESLVVNRKLECAALIASIQPVGTPVPVLAAGSDSPALFVGAVGLGLVLVSRDKGKLSGS